MKPEEAWTGSFGNEYHARNWVDWQKRVPFFRHILTVTGARSVLEFGCGPGWNLTACQAALETFTPRVCGVEINEEASFQAEAAGLEVADNPTFFWPCELVFTAGCLIHIPPEKIGDTMDLLIDRSLRYVMSIEYEAPEETEIEYRGQSGLLWKRPYIKMYEEKGLVLLETGKLQEDVGFDNCTYGLFTKGSK